MNWAQLAKKGKAAVISGGQWGSEAKGAVAAHLASLKGNEFDICTTAAGAQAGHTTVRDDGSKFVCFHLPTTAIIQGCTAYVNAGAIIDPAVLLQELEDTKFPIDKLVVHPNAAIITDEARNYEMSDGSSSTRIASTRKGVGEALAFKIRRAGNVAINCTELKQAGINIERIDLNEALQRGMAVVAEVPQGFSLSIDWSGQYPYTTSRNCWVGSGLEAAGIHPSFLGTTAMIVRTFPIRVGNIVKDGEQVGWSGPCYSGQKETSFEALGQPVEYTTVTKRPRRIFTFSELQYSMACSMNRPDIVVLTFVNYLRTWAEVLNTTGAMQRTHTALGLKPIVLYQYGPKINDVTNNLNDLMQREMKI